MGFGFGLRVVKHIFRVAGERVCRGWELGFSGFGCWLGL